MKLYVASSWRNSHQQKVVSFLRQLEHEVYDFRNPAANNNGFHWSEINGGWQAWTPQEFIDALSHPIAQNGFKCDADALAWADACILVLPSGRSAHLEAGWAIGQGKPTVVYMPDQVEPELMYKFAKAIVTDMPSIQIALFDGHSMGRYLPCSACGDIDGCSNWQDTNGNQYDSRKYRD